MSCAKYIIVYFVCLYFFVFLRIISHHVVSLIKFGSVECIMYIWNDSYYYYHHHHHHHHQSFIPFKHWDWNTFGLDFNSFETHCIILIINKI